jgi:ABC-type Fe3+-hydroxamate transport system substrate-binding protein
MLSRSITAAACTTLLIACATATSTAANAAERDMFSETTTMTVGGFDRDVAEAHGYEIVTLEDGRVTSVPLTPEARAEASRPDNRNTVVGPCGSATLTITRNNAQGGINIQTSYSVTTPTVGHHWGVTGSSNAGKVFTEGFGGFASGYSWSATHFTSVYGYGQGGWGQIDVGSFAQLTNGAVCFAGQARHTWK